jgi:hypothetical protein
MKSHDLEHLIVYHIFLGALIYFLFFLYRRQIDEVVHDIHVDLIRMQNEIDESSTDFEKNEVLVEFIDRFRSRIDDI